MTGRDLGRLERLERVRGVQERAARASWATAEARARDARTRVEGLADTLTRARAELDALLRERRLDEGELTNYERPLSVIEGHLQAARAEAEVREREAEREREDWSERERDRRAVERLGDHERERSREERLAADERAAEEVQAERTRRARSDPERLL